MNKKDKQVLDDAEWWRAMLPKGWRLYGFNERRNAAAWSPTDRLIDIDAELIIAMKK